MGRKLWLGPSQSQTVGRTARAGFSVSSDGHMSGIHFAVECGAAECRLRDLGSSNGTFLNDEPIEAAPIYDGDVIRAGDTAFVVCVTGGPPRPVQRIVRRADAFAAHVNLPSPRMAFNLERAFRSFPCRSGLTLMRGVATRFDIAEIFARLAEVAPMYMIVASSAEMDWPNGGAPAEPLVDKLADETADDGPMILGPAAGDDWLLSAASAWGNDCLICLFDHRPRAEVAHQLRQFVRESSVRPEAKHLASLRPLLLAEFLTNGEPNAVANAIQGVDAILVEVHQGERWAILGREDLKGALHKVGIAEAPAWV